ncbi:unnamed protein product [Cyclocybe aegerita]|uniref:Uncharacterized protein n=1 Tax=Cyclocybe aegerita TaxID=1973307 RepID=A0A8S0XR22_CYCAE|nr:unnamed protein product [Cyclocybe aegerita]
MPEPVTVAGVMGFTGVQAGQIFRVRTIFHSEEKKAASEYELKAMRKELKEFKKAQDELRNELEVSRKEREALERRLDAVEHQLVAGLNGLKYPGNLKKMSDDLEALRHLEEALSRPAANAGLPTASHRTSQQDFNNKELILAKCRGALEDMLLEQHVKPGTSGSPVDNSHYARLWRQRLDEAGGELPARIAYARSLIAGAGPSKFENVVNSDNAMALVCAKVCPF